MKDFTKREKKNGNLFYMRICTEYFLYDIHWMQYEKKTWLITTLIAKGQGIEEFPIF